MEREDAVALVAALLILIFFVAVPAVAVYRENSDLTLGQRAFALWVVLYLIVLPTSWNVVPELLPGLAVDAALVVAGVFVAYVFYQRVVRRARDAGKGKRIAYIGTIPIANLVVFAILMAKRSAAPAETAQAAEA